MSESFGLERSLSIFVAAPNGEPDTILGSIAAVIAENACTGEGCSISTTCNPYAKPERYSRRSRLADCSTCFGKKAIANTVGEPGDPDIVEVDQETYLRTEALDAMKEFWAVVDEATDSEASQVFEVDGRQRIEAAITARYVGALPTRTELS